MHSLQPLRPLVGRQAAVITPSVLLRQTQRRHNSYPPAIPPATDNSLTERPLPPRRRHKRKPPKKVPLYELPLSVIDLDAEDNEHVRPYNEALDAAPEEAKWGDAHASIDTLIGRFADLNQETAWTKKRISQMDENPTAWRILDRDIMSVALRGPRTYIEPTRSHDASKDETSVLTQVLYSNGISPRQTFQQLPLMLKREQATHGNSGTRGWKSLREVLNQCSSILEVRRVLGQALQTVEGRTEILSRNKPIAILLCLFIEKSTRVSDTARQVSQLLLNLSHALPLVAGMAGKGQNGAHLWAVGLWASALAGEAMAMQRFLRLGVASGRAEDVAQFMNAWTSIEAEKGRTEPPAVIKALLTVLEQLQTAAAAATTAATAIASTRVPTPPDWRFDLFALLTGAPRYADTDTPEASFRVLLSTPEIHEPQHNYSGIIVPATSVFGSLYTSMLAELGGVLTLWQVDQHRARAGLTMKPVGLETQVTAVLRCISYARRAAQASLPMRTRPETIDDAALEDLMMISSFIKAENYDGGALAMLHAKAGASSDMYDLPAPRFNANNAFRRRVERAFAQTKVENVANAIDSIVHEALEGEEGERGQTVSE